MTNMNQNPNNNGNQNAFHQKLQPNYYAILPANIRYDKNLNSTEKLLYAEITSLCDREGYCWASNTHFAEMLDKLPTYISQVISKLSNKGYIKVEVERSSKGTFRKIYIGGGIEKSITGVANKLDGDIEKTIEGYRNNYIQKNNTINNTNNIEIDKSISIEYEGKKIEETEVEETSTDIKVQTKTQNQDQVQEQEQEQEQEQIQVHELEQKQEKENQSEELKSEELISLKSTTIQKSPEQSKTKHLIKTDPLLPQYLEIAVKIKALVENQKRITITSSQVNSWATEIKKLYKTLEAARGSEDAIYGMHLMINSYSADTGYEDKYKPVIESGKSFREKFIKLEDYYKRRQIQYNKQQQEEDFII